MGLGDMLTAFQGNPTYSRVRVTKDPMLQSGINGAMADAAALNRSNKASLSDYVSKYLAGEGAAATRTGQELSALDSLYNGGMASSLAALRAQQNKATLDAADVASQQALRGLSLGRLGEQGTGGSYDSRMALGALMPIRVQAAITNAGRARDDMGYLTSLQQANVGRAQALADAQAAYRLAPTSVAQNLFSNNLNNLNGLAAVNNANNIFGVQQNKTSLDKWGSFLNAAQGNFQDTVGMGASAIGAMRGGGGGSL